jgi:transglycosylase-like protein with SLT domain
LSSARGWLPCLVVLAALLATVALAVGRAPPPGAPIPRTPAALAARIETTTRNLDTGIDLWRASGAARPPLDVTLNALYQQRIVILLTAKPALSRRVLARLPAADARPLEGELAVRRELARLSTPRPLSAFRTGPAAPADDLVGYYRAAQQRFGVAWNVLAAVNFIETAFNKLRNASTAGAQGPMQFIPSTWRRYGLGGNIRDPQDAILGAANYLHASGAPRNYRRALYHYNPSRAYVDAVLGYASMIRSGPRAFYVLYSRQVFVRTPRGLVRLTGPRRRRKVSCCLPLPFRRMAVMP